MSDTKYTPRESFWRGHWAAIDGTAQPTPNDDEAAYQRGAEHGARALAEAMRCKTYRERWAWIARYVSGAWQDAPCRDAYELGAQVMGASFREEHCK